MRMMPAAESGVQTEQVLMERALLQAKTHRNSGMKVLLVCPECPETFWSFKHALRIISRKALLPPLGLLTVAALLPAV